MNYGLPAIECESCALYLGGYKSKGNAEELVSCMLYSSRLSAQHEMKLYLVSSTRKLTFAIVTRAGKTMALRSQDRISCEDDKLTDIECWSTGKRPGLPSTGPPRHC